MNWLSIAIITPVTHAVTSHVDKFVLSKYSKSSLVGFLVILSCLFSFVCLPLIAFLDHTFSLLPSKEIITLVTSGMFTMAAFVFYFKALRKEEASIVVPLFQFVPVFGFFLGYELLGESLTRHQIGGSIIIVCGCLLLSFILDNSNVKIRKETLLPMILCSLLYALGGVLFRLGTTNTQNFLPSLFWNLMGRSVAGLLLLIFFKKYRTEFHDALESSSRYLLSLYFFNELLSITGEIATIFAILLAPVALVQVVSGLQPVFVLFFGIIITIFLPSIGTESFVKRHLIQKIAGIAIIFFGTVIINL